MREVSTGGGGGGLTSVNNNDKGGGGATNMVVRMSSTPGYLELSPEKMEELICQTPIEESYDVEDQPFARGKYAAVRRCRHRDTNQQFAAKFLKKTRRSVDLRPEIIHEVAILDACAASSRIVRLHRVFESQHEMVLLLELAPGGELQMLLDNDEVPEEVQVKKLMKQILDGLIFLHSINVAHLDLKPQNLVLTGEFPHCEVKLCDLGISRYISEGADIRDILGTPDYVAPEVLNYESISLATDMWSVGVLLYVLLTGCSPFGGDTKQETFCNISQCSLDFPDDLFEDISEDAIDLMKKLMVKDPSKRLDARQCLQHRWFSSNEVVARLSLTKTAVASCSPLPARKTDLQNVASPKLKHKAPVERTVGDAKPPPDTVATPNKGGIEPSRRDTLKRNLCELARKVSETAGDVAIRPRAAATFVPPPGAMRKARSMQVLPAEGRFAIHNPAEVRRRGQADGGCLYSFRRCVVIDDEDVSPPVSMGSSVYSDNSIGGDSAGEMSADSSSDRSSIVSLDDGLDFNPRSVRYENRNVWGRQRPTNETFASAFLRFSSGQIAPAPRRPPARGAHTTVLERGPPAPGPAKGPACRVEFRKERFGNVVVIREVRAGRYLQVNELKCESVQARIRRLQVQAVSKT